jgi:sigma-B regulation protein RsbU (phosphoserine phosphatase)
MTSSFRGALRAYADGKSGKNTVVEIVEKVNQMACNECKDGEFVSLFYAILDVKAMTVNYCNCGHEPAILIRGKKIIELQKGGLVLGLEPRAEHEIATLHLEDGDCLLFYTDGLTDAVNFDGQFWGRNNLLKTAKKFINDPAEHMLKSILGYRRRFVGLAHQTDDTSIIVVKVHKAATPLLEA